MTVDEVRAIVRFTERRFRGYREIPVEEIDHPVLDKIAQLRATADLPIVDGSDEPKE
jgi:hypothetical protein